MTFSLDTYTITQQKLLDKVTELQDLLDEMKLDIEMRKLKEIKNNLLEERFQVVVVGEFSRGKSTFINALLGKKILPSSAKPTTTILNKIVYGTEPGITLHFRDAKRSKKITEELFAKLVAPKEPIPGDVKTEKEYEKQVQFIQEIEYAEIAHPLSFSENGVEIIDTPGTNDLDPAREEITNNIIPKSDAAILILSALKILSESELSFLRDRLLASDIQKIFIIVNFKDLLESKEDERKVLEFAYTHLKDVLQQPKIHMVAAKQALNARRKQNGEELGSKRGRRMPVWDLKDTGFVELENNLADFLQFERGAVKLQKPIQQVTKLIKEIKKKHISLERNALSKKREGLKEKIENFRPKLVKTQETGNEALKKMYMELKKEEQGLLQWYQKETEKIYSKGLETFEESRHLSVNEISRKVENTIAPLERTLHINKKNKMTETAKACINLRSRDLNEEWGRLEGELVNLSSSPHEDDLLPAVKENDGMNEYSLFDEIFEELDDAWGKSNSLLGKVVIGAGYVATAIAGGITALFRAGWSWLTGENEKTRFKRDLLEQFEASKKKKLSSFKKDWSNLGEGIRSQYKEIVERNIQQMNEQLNQLIKTTQLEEKDIHKTIDILNHRDTRLTQIEKDLPRLLKQLQKKTKEKAGVL
ncbi:dynamin family protein [Rossellomorea sp. NS-SX7]|uniref:dynamin family protein n=1 Tax=Rossellomorea sp. NS-SX7 TaxID=3463856 RepID=UPI004058625A